MDTFFMAVVIILTIAGLIMVGRAILKNDDLGIGRGFLLRFGAFGVMIVAGLAGVGFASLLISWLDLSENAALYMKLGFFFVVLIAIGWSYEKLRDWWASRE